MSDVADLTIEILKQIRDGVFEVKAEVTGLRNQVTYLHEEQIKTRTELKTEIADLRQTVVRVARVNDATLAVSLEDSGRVEVLEGRVRVLEAQVEELRARH